MSSPPVLLHCGRKTLDLSRPVVMGVLNVTPDSFSDGGRYFSVEAAVEQGVRMVAEGAALIDVGGESTRPGAEPVSAAEELRRVLPVLERLATASSAVISIDTSKPEVMREEAAAGAGLINDVRALREPGAPKSAAGGRGGRGRRGGRPHQCGARPARAGRAQGGRGERLRGVPGAHAG